MDSANRILEGVRIITFTSGYAGPYAGRLLAQYGADVIKVESLHGGLDSFRHFAKKEDVDSAPRFIECNLGVRSVTINLKHPTGVRLIKELAAHSDAVLENFRPGVLKRLGLGDDALREANPRLVILKLPGLGGEGPKSWYGSWGFNLNAFSGMTHLWNHPGQPRPVGSQGVYPDHLGFISGPTILVAALIHQRLTGKGASIDLAQVEMTAYTLGVSYLESIINGEDPEPKGNRDPTAAPHGCYRCKGEDRWCVISVRTDEEWRGLCAVMGRPELLSDARFCDRLSRGRNADELDKLVSAWTEAMLAEEITLRLQAERVPAGVVQSAADLLQDPQLRHRNYFHYFPASPVGSFEISRGALVFEGMAEEPLSLPARLGEHTDQVMRDTLGYDEATIAQWRKEEVLR